MDILKIVGIGIITLALSIYLKDQNQAFALYATLAGGIIILAIGYTYLSPVIVVIYDYTQKTTITNTQLSAVFKIIGTAYLAQFAADICTDAGNSSLAGKIEISARFMIAFFSLPLVLTLFEYISSII